MWEPLSSRYVLVNLWLNIILYSVLFAASIGFRWLPPFENLTGYLSVATAIFAFLIPAMTTWGFMSDKKKRFSLREQDISFSSGIFVHRLVTQPMLRVQHVELTRGPIERKAGLASLQVFSAGGSSHTFTIPGLPVEKAKQIRQFILSHGDLTQHDK
ncbi:PH domain-containing protein [Veronia pacifica]|uniref:PH domain-containing protein n=1 Tax=Veronia pacifica TaxID=1080227 RepID=UPI001C307694|nr:PH domain-containing protein [Veronia pacifica]